MKNVWIIMKKELMRVLKDPKLIIMLLLPGIIIYFMYSLMGSAMTGDTFDADTTFNVFTINMPEEAQESFAALNARVENVDLPEADIAAKVEEKTPALKDKTIALIIVFDEGYVVDGAVTEEPLINVYYDSADSLSTFAYQSFSEFLGFYKDACLEAEGYNPAAFAFDRFDIGNVALDTLAKFVPFILITFLFNGCMAVAPDSIAGEKERGTIATALITPIKRRELALGKVFSLSILAVISAISSFVGLMLSLPAMMGVSAAEVGEMLGFGQYLAIFLVLVSTVLFIIGVMSIISSFAKTVKEANMLLMPFMFLSMFVGLTTMFGSGAATSTALYFIPLYNTVQSMISVMMGEMVIINLVITFISNLVCLGASVFVLTKLFNSEKVMFKK